MQRRVLLADDHGIMLDEVNHVLLLQSCRVVASASNGPALLRAAAAVSPDLIVLDISMPKMSGIEVARRLTQSGCRARLIFLTVHSEPEFVAAAFDAGASAYVLKTRLVTDLPTAIESAFLDRRFLSPSVRKPVMNSAAPISELHGRGLLP